MSGFSLTVPHFHVLGPPLIFGRLLAPWMQLLFGRVLVPSNLVRHISTCRWAAARVSGSVRSSAAMVFDLFVLLWVHHRLRTVTSGREARAAAGRIRQLVAFHPMMEAVPLKISVALLEAVPCVGSTDFALMLIRTNTHSLRHRCRGRPNGDISALADHHIACASRTKRGSCHTPSTVFVDVRLSAQSVFLAACSFVMLRTVTGNAKKHDERRP